MKLIKETNRGEIKIVEYWGINYVISNTKIGFDLATKYGKKYNAIMPNIHTFFNQDMEEMYNLGILERHPPIIYNPSAITKVWKSIS